MRWIPIPGCLSDFSEAFRIQRIDLILPLHCASHLSHE